MISSDGNHDNSLMEAGDAVEGLVITTHAFPVPGSTMDDLYKRFEKATGNPPPSVVVGVGYDEMYIIKTALEAAGKADPEALGKALMNIKDFKGVSGTYTMDPKTRRAMKSVTLLKVEGGKFNFLDQFYPKYVPDV